MTAIVPDIPNELVLGILNYLDFRSLLKCRTVCSAFRDLVDSSPNFHWKKELTIAGKEDGGNYPLTVRREMLEEYQRGWTNLQWTKGEKLPNRGGCWELYGNVFAQEALGNSEIQFKQLPSRSRSIPERDWTVDARGFQIQDFGMDPAQDLLIVVENPTLWQGVDNHRVLLLSLSTGEPHPLATGTHILIHKPRLRHGPCSIQICFDTLAVMFDDDDLHEGEIVFWNWKTGQVVTNIVNDIITTMTFLSDRHVIFGIFQPFAEPNLVVVDFVAETSKRRKLQDMENAITFRFPPFAESAHVLDLNIRSYPSPDWIPDPALSVPFHSARHDRLYVIALPVQVNLDLTRMVRVHALASSFLSCIKTAVGQSPRCFDWDMWGPMWTRMTLSQVLDSQWFTRCVYGTRHVSTRKQQGQQADYVYVCDFNQLALRWSAKDARGAATSETDVDDESIMDQADAEASLPYVNVTAPSKIADDEIFQVEVETKLGYRVKRWAIPGKPRVRSVMCSEDGVVIVYGADIGDEFHVLTV